MRFKLKNIEIYVEYVFIIAAFFCIIPQVRRYLGNYYICYLFILFHELSHIFIASLFGINVTRICIRLCGLNIKLDDKSKASLKWILIFLAGPISNILLCIIFKKVPIIFYINLCLAIINMVPIYPLDGYNILKIIMTLLKLKNVKEKLVIIQKLFVIFLGILGLIQLVKFENPSIILITIYTYIQKEKKQNSEHKSLYQKYYKNITKI